MNVSNEAIEAQAGRSLTGPDIERRRTALLAAAEQGRLAHVREVALRAAVDLVAASYGSQFVTSGDRPTVIRFADVFERYLIGGKEAVDAHLASTDGP